MTLPPPATSTITIATQFKLFSMGQIKTLWEEAMPIASRRKPISQNDDRAAQHAADQNNWRTANARLCRPEMVAPIGNNNFGSIQNLYAKKNDPPPPNPSFTSVPYNPSKIHHLPDNISKSILNRIPGIDAYMRLFFVPAHGANSSVYVRRRRYCMCRIKRSVLV